MGKEAVLAQEQGAVRLWGLGHLGAGLLTLVKGCYHHEGLQA